MFATLNVMARFLIAVLTFILNCQAEGQDSSSWFWQNPLPQGNALNDVHAFDQISAVAVGNAGTVIKTTDGGIHWAVQHYAGRVLARLNAVSFLDESVGTAVGDSGIVIRSTDGGHTWQEWSRIAGVLNARDIWFMNVDTGVVLSELSIYRTNDCGKSWNQVHSNSFGFLSVAFADESTGVACGQGGIIARTTDGGITWTDQQIANYYAGLASIGFANERVGYTVGLLTGSDTTSQGPICLRTTDCGQSWAIRSFRVPLGTLAIHVVDSLTVLSIGSREIFVTTDGAITWQMASISSPPVSSLSAISISATGSGFAVGDFGMILRTIDGGDTWSHQSSRLDRPYYYVSGVAFPSRDTGTVVSSYGVIYRTTTGGSTWENQLNDSTILGLSDASFTSVNTETVVGWNGTILRTSNAGELWTRQLSGTTNHLRAVHFPNPKTGYIVGWRGTFLRTTDGGSIWEYLPISDHYLDDVAFVDSSTGIAVGWYGLILRSTDSGTSWSIQSVNQTSWLQGVTFFGATSVIAVGANGVILRSADSGISWAQMESGTIDYLYDVGFADPERGIAVGGGGIIVRTSDGGVTWTRDPSGTTNSLVKVAYASPNVITVVGEGGAILRTTTGGVTWREEKTTNLPSEDFTLRQNYPNPFNPSTEIRLDLPRSTHVILSIYDVMGRLVEVLVDDELKKGRHSFIWGPSDISSGVYFYRLQIPAGSITKKLLLLR